MATPLYQACLLLVFVVTGAFCQVELQSPCHPVNRAANLEACLAAIGNMATDPSHFWFGNQYLIDCPPARQDNINCSTYLTDFPYTLAQRLFKEDTTDLSALDRYLNVKYTSPPGSYYACLHTYVEQDAKEFEINPIGDPSQPFNYKSWEMRFQPEITWDTSSTDPQYFTLMIINPDNVTVHGLFVNMENNNLDNAEVLVEYVSPFFFRREHNGFVYLLYKHQKPVVIDPNEELDYLEFNVPSFVKDHQLEGPIALSIAQVMFDPYGILQATNKHVGHNCNEVMRAARVSHPERPFLPNHVILSAHFYIKIVSDPVTYRCNGRNVTHSGASYWHDAVANQIVNTADIRADFEHMYYEYHLSRNQLFPDNATDFYGKFYTVIMVNPDVSPNLGTNRMPYLVALRINMDGGPELTGGYRVKSYTSPVPPGPDTGAGYVYYLLYEQADTFTLTDTIDFTHPSACYKSGRCFFDVTKFTTAYNLKLVGATWVRWTRDEYHKCTEY